MATKKKLLQAAAGTAAAGGAGALNVEDVFSTYLYEGNGGTKVIENGINLGQSYGSGSVEFEQNSSYLKLPSEITLTGDFTIEAMVWSNSGFTSQNQILGSDTGGGSNLNTQVYIQNTTNYLSLYDNGAAHRSTSAVPQDQWVHIAITRSGSTVTFYINGTASGTSSTSATIAVWAVGALIAGATVYEDYYGYISNVRIVDGSVVYTSNFTPPTSDLTAITNTQLLTCQGDSPFVDNSSNSYALTATNTPIAKTFGPFDAADAGEGGLVWLKERSLTNNHMLFDTERGVSVALSSNNTGANNGPYTNFGVTSYNSSGFSIGSAYVSETNDSGQTYASWTFRKAPKFFDVVTYTGNSTARTISHNLGTTVGTIFIKKTSAAADWIVYHRSTGATDYLELNTTNAAATYDMWNNTAPTSTEFSLSSYQKVNETGATYVAYLFAHNDGDGTFGPTGDQDVIRCGSYTGNGSGTDGPEINLGWEAQWVMIKKVDTGSNYTNWCIFDNMRGFNEAATNDPLGANLSDSEGGGFLAGTFRVTAKSYGFKVSAGETNVNTNGGTYIYIAIRRGSMAVPTDATDVFDVNTYNATGVAGNPQTTGFPVDLAIIGQRQATDSWKHGVLTRLTGAVNYLVTSSTSGEQNAGGGINIDNMTGYDFQSGAFNTASPAGMYNLNWKRAPSFFDVVAYTGNGTAQTITHNLGVTPEFILLKNRSTVVQWTGYHKDLNGGTNPAHYKIVLNQTNGEGGSSHWNYTSPTSSDFTVGSSMSASSNNYIAYLFASLDGVSKVGSFTMAGSDINVDCGFSSGARFVLLKRTDSTGNWLVFDSERGIVAGADPYLLLNTTDGEDVFGALDIIDPYSSGFTAVSANIANGNWIFYAIA